MLIYNYDLLHEYRKRIAGVIARHSTFLLSSCIMYIITYLLDQHGIVSWCEIGEMYIIRGTIGVANIFVFNFLKKRTLHGFSKSP